MFEHIECEWPLFFCYLILDSCFRGDKDSAFKYTAQLEEVRIEDTSTFQYKVTQNYCNF